MDVLPAHLITASHPSPPLSRRAAGLLGLPSSTADVPAEALGRVVTAEGFARALLTRRRHR